MKVERKDTEFQPIIITLENQFEVDVITEYLSFNKNTNNAGVWIDALYRQMQQFRKFSGRLDNFPQL